MNINKTVDIFNIIIWIFSGIFLFAYPVVQLFRVKSYVK